MPGGAVRRQPRRRASWCVAAARERMRGRRRPPPSIAAAAAAKLAAETAKEAAEAATDCTEEELSRAPLRVRVERARGTAQRAPARKLPRGRGLVRVATQPLRRRQHARQRVAQRGRAAARA